jgi:HK97 gp10 family phage protein
MSDGGLASFQRRMKAIPEAVRQAVAPSLLAAAEDVADAQRALAPKDEGDLAASIVVTGPMQSTPPYSQPGGAKLVPENAVAITAGNTDVRYPHLQEFGTSFHPAHPYFWPGFRLTRKAALAKIKRAIGRAVRAAR